MAEPEPDAILTGVTPPLDGRAFRWSVGTRPVPEGEWLIVDDQRHALLAAKDRLFDAAPGDVIVAGPGDVIVAGPGDDAAADELLQLVLADLAARHPETFEVTPNAVSDRATGRRTELAGRPAMDTVGRLVAEDFCLLTPVGDRWVLTSASVCFTSRWSLREKIGQDMSGIHEPVPGYESRLGAAVDSVFARLEPGKVLARSNWTLLDTDELHLPAPAAAVPATTDVTNLGYLRVERQTLRRLPESGAIVFTILTRVRPVSELSPDDRDRLLSAVAAAPADIAEYKSWPAGGPG